MLKQSVVHNWDLSPHEAVVLQQELRARVIRANQFGPVRYVAGIDVGFEQQGAITRAAVAVLSFPALELVETAISRLPTTFPYVPGLLSFRELPAVLTALEQLQQWPDLFLCDGQGIAHPRRFGIASHLGVLLDIATIGVGKTRLWGQHDSVPEERGGWVELRAAGDVIGAVLRTRVRVKPVFVSIGHRIDLAQSIHYVMACTTRYRLPETTRFAHRLASGP